MLTVSSAAHLLFKCVQSSDQFLQSLFARANTHLALLCILGKVLGSGVGVDEHDGQCEESWALPRRPSSKGDSLNLLDDLQTLACNRALVFVTECKSCCRG